MSFTKSFITRVNFKSKIGPSFVHCWICCRSGSYKLCSNSVCIIVLTRPIYTL